MKLAINGGDPVIEDSIFHGFPNVDKEEILGILGCFNRNIFSGFRAGDYDGGLEVMEFEKTVAGMTGASFAVSFDTWSNGIVATLLSLGLESGDEVLITPYTMTSCATSILSCGAIPIFVDVCEDSGCIDPVDIKRKISNKTKAIFVVHLFGIPADMDAIMEIAEDNNLFVFEDCAQSPLSFYKGQLCGLIGDVGGFSLTESKHVTSGEGGIAITNDIKINNGLRYVRNHGEVCSSVYGNNDNHYHNNMYGTSGLIGYNFRMTEIAAAFANAQWKKLEGFLAIKRKMVEFLIHELNDVGCLEVMVPAYDHIPSWYNFPLRYDDTKTGVSREKFVEALNAEGLHFACGYVSPLYNQEIYTTKKHWVIRDYAMHVDYTNPACPVAERLYSRELITTLDIRLPYDLGHMKKIVAGIKKVFAHIEELR